MLPFEPPFTLGDENAGGVAQLGAGVRGVEEGQPVVVYGPWGCGRCDNCARRSGEPLRTPRRRRRRGRRSGPRRWPRAVDDRPVGATPRAVDEPRALAGGAARRRRATPYRVIRKWRHLLVPGSSAVVLGRGVASATSPCSRSASSPRHASSASTPRPAACSGRPTSAPRSPCWRATTAAEVRDATGGRGAEPVLDFVGSADTLAVAAAVARPLGHVAIVGAGGGTLACGYFGLPYEVSVSTTYWGSTPS